MDEGVLVLEQQALGDGEIAVEGVMLCCWLDESLCDVFRCASSYD
jgi:hypothetical protein